MGGQCVQAFLGVVKIPFERRFRGLFDDPRGRESPIDKHLPDGSQRVVVKVVPRERQLAVGTDQRWHVQCRRIRRTAHEHIHSGAVGAGPELGFDRHAVRPLGAVVVFKSTSVRDVVRGLAVSPIDVVMDSHVVGWRGVVKGQFGGPTALRPTALKVQRRLFNGRQRDLACARPSIVQRQFNLKRGGLREVNLWVGVVGRGLKARIHPRRDHSPLDVCHIRGQRGRNRWISS